MDIKNNLDDMLMSVISLVFIAIILPIGLIYIINIGDVNVVFNGANVTLSDTGADTVITLLSTLVPITIAIGIVINYLRNATK
ncbi:MAG: hypothetical protein ACFFAO_02195 [Candidatus Hermodarchaeota archaeon]